MTSKRDLNQELFATTTTAPAATTVATKEISLSELADLSELTEEQAKLRIKITQLSTGIEALTDEFRYSDRRFTKLKDALTNAVSQVERLSRADNLHEQQFGALTDSLRAIETQIEAHQNALAFLRNSDGQQQQTIDRLKQSRITLTHILLFGCLLFSGVTFFFDVSRAFGFQQRLTHIEQHLSN